VPRTACSPAGAAWSRVARWYSGLLQPRQAAPPWHELPDGHNETPLWNAMEKLLSSVGSLLYGMRVTMLFFYVGLVTIIFGILGKFLLETYKLMNTLLFGELGKIDLIIKVLELVDMTMVAQLVWVVALAGVSLFVTTGHFDSKDMKKPDWLDHVNTYNLKLKLAFAIISISGVHALKTYLSGDLSLENIQIVTMVAVIHFTFVLSAIGISYAERLTREKH
jgi:uncharacterized protein (TIGR00645 family)